MKNKIINFKSEVEPKLLSGLSKIYIPVSSTLGPNGKNVVIENEMGGYKITKDGVTVAKSISVSDEVEDTIIQLVKHAAQDTNSIAGDGTTTSTILAANLIMNGFKLTSKGINSVELKNGMQKAVTYVTTQLKHQSKDISGLDDVEYVARISSNNDIKIASLIREAIAEVGHDGLISVEDNTKNEDYLEVVSGMQISNGYLSHYFINNMTDYTYDRKDAKLLIFDGSINDPKLISSLLSKSIQKDVPLVIIANHFSDHVLSMLVLNTTKLGLKVAAIKNNAVGDLKSDLLGDIAVLTGSKLHSPKVGTKLDKLELDDLGSCERIVIGKTKTNIIGGFGKSDEIEERVRQIDNEKEAEPSPMAQERYVQRIANLIDGVAIIRLGSETSIELSERKDRMEDALNATKAAIKEGIIPGGGTMLTRIKHGNWKTSNEFKQCNSDERIGFELLVNTLDAPFDILLSNANISSEVVWDKIKRSPVKGYDVRLKKYVSNMYESGIIDPTLVVNTALEKASSVASLFLTTNAFINIDKSDESNKESDSMYM